LALCSLSKPFGNLPNSVFLRPGKKRRNQTIGDGSGEFATKTAGGSGR